MGNRIRLLAILTLLAVILAAFVAAFLATRGGEDDPDSTATVDVGQIQTPVPGGRPTTDPDLLTEVANATPKVGPTHTPATGADVALAISTTASQPCVERGDPETGIMSVEQYFENVKCIEPYYPWPMDRRIDFEKYQEMFGGERSGFGPQFQYSGIESFHVCAWFETWLDAYAIGNDDRAGAALDVILNFIPNYANEIPGYPPEMSGGGPAPYRRFGEAAALGDPSQIQMYVDGNCGWLPDWKVEG